MANKKQRRKRRREITRRQKEATRRNKYSELETTVDVVTNSGAGQTYEVPRIEEPAYGASKFPTNKEIRELSTDERRSLAFAEALATGDETVIDRYFGPERRRDFGKYAPTVLVSAAVVTALVIAVPEMYGALKNRIEYECGKARIFQKIHDQLPDQVRELEERPEMPWYCFDGIDHRISGGPAIK